jgi:serine/threonine-protein kinase
VEATALPRRLEQFVKVCDAIAYAHSRDVIHRDLKPENIMLGRWGEVYVMDWGLAKLLGGEHEEQSDEQPEPPEPEAAARDRTRQGQMLGTPRYMAPEQAKGDIHLMSQRSDVATLGVILYELVTLRKARDAEDFVELLKMARAGGLGPRSHAVERVRIPRELWAVIDKACARAPEARYAHAGELAEDVRRYLRNEAVLADPDTPVQRIMRRMSRSRQATFTVLLGLLLLVAGLISAGLYRQQRAAERALRREERLAVFLSRVGHRAGRIDTYFFGVQNRLTKFSTAIRELSLRGRVSDDPVYLAEDFRDPSARPAGLIPSPRYNADVSFTFADFALPPGADRTALQDRMKQLSPIRHTLRDVLLGSRELSERTASLDEAAAETYAARKGLPIDRCYFGSADGMNIEMPGQYWDSAGFDPRVRPWYKLADRRRGYHWGNPFVEIATEALLISCSTGVWDEKDTFLGVAGVGIAVRYIVTELLTIEEEPSVTATFLIDGEGHIVVASADADKEVKLGRLDRGEELAPYAHADAIADAAGRGGVARIERDGTEYLIVHRPLQASGWRYVVEAKSGELLAE